MDCQLAVFLCLAIAALVVAAADESCVDVIANCASYGQQTCLDYADWSRINCPYTCQFCTGPTPPRECKDMVDNCQDYVEDICTNHAYRVWAEDNCFSYCGFCGTATTAPTTQPSQPPIATSSGTATTATITQSSQPTTATTSGTTRTATTSQSSQAPTTTPSVPGCDDQLFFCYVYSPKACSDTTWADTYCKRFCNRC
ncbi:hypothetical protein BsWGS_04277 [Bradybaena similaris]